MKTKQEKAAYLFDEIGGVDDRFIAEAGRFMNFSAPAKPRTGRTYRGLALIAACLLIFCMVDGMVLFFRLGNGFGIGADEKEEEPIAESLTVEGVLLESTGYQNLSSAGELDFYDGDARLVWQKAGEESVSVSRALTQAEINRLFDLISLGTDVGESSPEPEVRLWILLGDGRVVTPFLKPSAGTVGNAELFDYNAERELPEQFAGDLYSILH